MRRAVIMASVMLLSLTAFAGKAEREYMKNEVAPAVKAAEAKFKEACGCALKITVKDSIKTTDDMYEAKHIAESVTEGAPEYCTDAESKKAVCQMKSLDITKDKEAKFTFKDGKGVASTDGQVYTSFELMTRELDK